MANLNGPRCVMKRLIAVAVLALCFPLTAGAAEKAEDRWFEVELLLFTVDDKAAVAAEHWPDDPGAPRVADSIELAPPSMADDDVAVGGTGVPVVPYQRLLPGSQRLVAMENKLALSGQFTPFLHLAWRQPAFSRGTPGTAVHIQWRDEGAPGASLPTVDDSLAAPPATGLGGSLLEGGPARQAARLDGVVTVSVNRYLHLDVDLLYDDAHEVAPRNNLFGLFSLFKGPSPPHQFRMQQRRRLRSGELHYFDHPRFGMIALVTPYDYPRPQAEAASEAGDEARQ